MSRHSMTSGYSEWLPSSDVTPCMDRLRAADLANPVDLQGDESGLVDPVRLIVDQTSIDWPFT